MGKDTAVSKKKKRKREIQGSQGKLNKKKKLDTAAESQNVENDAEEHDGSDAENTKDTKQTPVEEKDELSGKFLRKSFNSADGLRTLQKFIVKCEDNKKDIAAEYLEAGGSVLEVLRLLDSSDKSSFNNVCTVFSAMQILIMKILDKYPQNQSHAEEACRHLINSHLASIHSMLSSQGKAKHHKVVLRLLAAIVSLGGSLPRELLNHLSLHTELVDVLVSHTKPTDQLSVRICYIHFILAFLIEGDTQDIKALLGKHKALSSIFSGLVYDYPNIVQLVLTTVRKYVLENPTITKTTKLHVFSTQVIQSIVNLYNWKGPKNYPVNKKQAPSTEHIDPDEKEVVLEAVHEFLILLLTSKKHGVAFHGHSLSSDSTNKHNQLINTVLQSLDKPWEHDRPSDLILKVLSACPDLIKPQLKYTETYIAPRASKKWAAVIDFVRKIIKNINVEDCIKSSVLDMTLNQTTHSVLNLLVPPVIMKGAVHPSMEHDSSAVHHIIISLLLDIMEKVKELLATLENYNTYGSDHFACKNIVLQHIIKNMPNFETIFKVWVKSVSSGSKSQVLQLDEEIPFTPIEDRLMTILDFLEARINIIKENSSNETTDLTDIPENPSILLSSLDELQGIEDDVLDVLKVKALKVLLGSDLMDFSYNKGILKSSILFLIPRITSDNPSLASEVCETSQILMNRCGCFEGHIEEIEIWLNSIYHVESSEDRLEIANWIVKIIKKLMKQMDHSKILKESKGPIEPDCSEDIITTEVSSSVPMLPDYSMSPFLCCALDTFTGDVSKVLDHYLSVVLIHVLHCQIIPTAFTGAIKKLNVTSIKYLTCWSDEHPLAIKKPFKSGNIFRKLSTLLESDDEFKAEAKGNVIHVRIGEDLMNYTLAKFDVKALLRMVIFHLTRSLSRENSDSINILQYQKIISPLLIVANETGLLSKNTIDSIFSWIFKHSVILQHFEGLYEDEGSVAYAVTKFLIQIQKKFLEFGERSFITNNLQPYREKFMQQIKHAIAETKKKKDIKIEIKGHAELMELLQFDIKTIAELFSEIITLPVKSFITNDRSGLSVWGFLVPLMMDQFSMTIIKHIEGNAIITIQEESLKTLFLHITELKIVHKQKVDSWEMSFYQYLRKYPHSISVINDKIFTRYLTSNISHPSGLVINFLIQKDFPKFSKAFTKVAIVDGKVIQKKELILSVIANNLNQNWDQEFLVNTSKHLEADVIAFLTEFKTAEFKYLEDSTEAVAFLIENSFDADKCKKICEIILCNGNKLDAASEPHVKLFSSIFKRSSGERSANLKDFIQVLVHIMAIALKRSSKDAKKLTFLCDTLSDAISNLELENEDTFEELSKNFSWPQYTRISLKVGLKIIKDKEKDTSFLLKTLATMCDIAYKDDGAEEYVKTMFEMTTSHSEFMNVMLSNAVVKVGLTELLWVLIRKNPSVISLSHIPVYLAAYGATMSTSDQYILQILHYYETIGLKMTNYRPYLWGNAAATHYSVKGTTDTALWRQPSTTQVLDLLISETVVNTIKKFPVSRSWKIGNLMASEDQIYDPAFYLPTFTYLLADNNVVACHKVIHSGALALTLAACSSTCEKIRMAAFTVISRFYTHLESSSSREKLLWINLIDSLRNGILNKESSLQSIRLNGFVATFLARTSIDMTQPLNPLYAPLQAFLMAKPALDLDTIPEFLNLFHSSEIQHETHRHWVLEIIHFGLKVEDDMEVASRCMLFKLLLNFYQCTLADKSSKVVILQIIQTVTKLNRPCMILLNSYALLPWLVNVTKNLRKGQIDSIVCVIDIAQNVLNVLVANKLKDCNHHYLMLSRALIYLMLSFNQYVTKGTFQSYVDLLEKIIANKTACRAITKSYLEEVVKFSQKILEDIGEFEIMLRFGCKYVGSGCVGIPNSSAEDSLRKLIVTWYNNRSNE
ncbi:hypothetical protein QAD02_016300 [Eretmocerus hayati]|uniref:Uncharacterized protein n=1 Tax=Eretmocerus hayati TaxID=131215 RepID=A0ACC2PAQ1_9HYME|nr:hypothetical protein QAD02_016300 [Eretmocerus hayati]